MNKTSILIVEDDRPIRNLIVTTLKTHEYKYLHTIRISFYLIWGFRIWKE